jgi:CheY-like chemotaxis protein
MKLWLGFAVLAVTLAAVGAGILVSGNLLQRELEVMEKHELPASEAAYEMEAQIVSIGLNAISYLNTGHPDHRLQVAQEAAAFAEHKARLERLATAAGQKTLNRRLGATFREYMTAAQAMMDAKSRNKPVTEVETRQFLSLLAQLKRLLNDEIQSPARNRLIAAGQFPAVLVERVQSSLLSLLVLGLIAGALTVLISRRGFRKLGAQLNRARETQQRVQGSAEQQERQTGELLARVAHDFRNALSPIHNVLQLGPMMANDPQAAAEARQIMERQIRRLMELVGDIEARASRQNPEVIASEPTGGPAMTPFQAARNDASASGPIPASAESASGMPERKEDASDRDETAGKRKVLVVDDHKDSAHFLSLWLGAMGCEVRKAHDGLEAVETAASFRPDVVVLDIDLPKLNGYDAARRIREQSPGRTLKLIALTGWDQDEDRGRAQSAGFDHYLVKPLEFEALQALLGAPAPQPT